MRAFRPLALAVVMLAGCAAPARADLTAFLGVDTTPTNRVTTGGSLGLALVIVGFEFEYSSTTEDEQTGAPSLKIGSGNVFLQTPGAIHGIQPYFTVGIGVGHERVGDDSDTGITQNIGGGARLSLAGPFRLRVDYRVFSLDSGARYSPSHRIYAGLNLKF